jgi:hypothetical protein
MSGGGKVTGRSSRRGITHPQGKAKRRLAAKRKMGIPAAEPEQSEGKP